MQPQTARYNKPAEFWRDFWFTPYHLVTVVNPTSEDYYFKVEGRHFVVRGGQHEDVLGTVANIYLSHMAKLLAQRDKKFKHFVDFNLRAAYYNQLIVNVKNLNQSLDSTPAYLKDMPQSMQVNQGGDIPPWTQQQEPVEAPAVETPPWQPTTVAPEQTSLPKGFERGSDKYHMTVSENGRTNSFKNGKRISKAEYEEASKAQ